MRIIFSLFTLIFLFLSCTDDNEINTSQEIPQVSSNAIYDVTYDGAITYAQGLSHSDWNSDESLTVDLLMDAYIPQNDDKNRPVLVWIHGGGFKGGSRTTSSAENMCNYFASRGWVAFSIDYRVLDGHGTLPTEWNEYGTNIPSADLEQFKAMYPAHRDAKAAVRWVMANAENYGINKDYLTIGGGSAGAITSIGISVTEADIFRDEILIASDPTLSTANLEESYDVKTILDFWGSNISTAAHELVYGMPHFDVNDPPLMIVHGTEDPTVPFSGAETLKATYDQLGIPVAYYPLEGKGHGAWNATVDGKRLEELSFDFVVEQQELTIE